MFLKLNPTQFFLNLTENKTSQNTINTALVVYSMLIIFRQEVTCAISGFDVSSLALYKSIKSGSNYVILEKVKKKKKPFLQDKDT